MKSSFLRICLDSQAALSKLVVFILAFVFLTFPFSVWAAGSLTSVKDTLINDRPSVATTITSTITAGDTTINVGSTAGINQGDTITICNASCSTTETKVVAGVLNSSQLGLTVGAANTYSSGNVYEKITSKHTITFTTRSTVNNGKFVVAIPATNTTTPISASFGLNNITTATSTEYTLTGFTATTMATSTSGSNINFTFNFTGSVASTTAISIAMGNTNPMLNPTKTAAQGTADTYQVVVTEQDGSGNTIDTTSVSIGTIEAVAVSATVSPSLTFTINAVASGSSVAGVTTDAASTATSSPFGTLTAATNRTVAQYIHIDTNSNSGYVVTAQSDGQLRKTNGTFIPDFNTTAADNNTVNGFGYSLQDKINTPSVFHYNDTGTFFSKGFSSSTAVTIMSNGSAASGDESYVVYRVRVSATQAQGTYQNLITYIATATY